MAQSLSIGMKLLRSLGGSDEGLDRLDDDARGGRIVE